MTSSATSIPLLAPAAVPPDDDEHRVTGVDHPLRIELEIADLLPPFVPVTLDAQVAAIDRRVRVLGRSHPDDVLGHVIEDPTAITRVPGLVATSDQLASIVACSRIGPAYPAPHHRQRFSRSRPRHSQRPARDLCPGPAGTASVAPPPMRLPPLCAQALCGREGRCLAGVPLWSRNAPIVIARVADQQAEPDR